MGVRPFLQAFEDSAAREEGDSSVAAYGFTADIERPELSSHGEAKLELDAPSHSSVNVRPSALWMLRVCSVGPRRRQMLRAPCPVHPRWILLYP